MMLKGFADGVCYLLVYRMLKGLARGVCYLLVYRMLKGFADVCYL